MSSTRGLWRRIYEYNTQSPKKGIFAVLITLCLKEKIQKINPDHEYWFFNAFGPIIRPNVRVLLDVGPYLVSPRIIICGRRSPPTRMLAALAVKFLPSKTNTGRSF